MPTGARSCRRASRTRLIVLGRAPNRRCEATWASGSGRRPNHDDPQHSGYDEQRRQRGPPHIGARPRPQHLGGRRRPLAARARCTARGPSLAAGAYRRGCARGPPPRDASRRWRDNPGEEKELPSSDTDAALVVRSEQAARNEAGRAGDDRVRAALAAIVEAGRTPAALPYQVSEAETRVANRRQNARCGCRVRDDAAQDLGIAAWVADLEASRSDRRVSAAVAGCGRRAGTTASGSRIKAARPGSLAEAVWTRGRTRVCSSAGERLERTAVRARTLEQSIGAGVEAGPWSASRCSRGLETSSLS